MRIKIEFLPRVHFSLFRETIKTLLFGVGWVNFVKRILCILKINSIKSRCTTKQRPTAKHQTFHIKEFRLIAIELIENKLDENKESIELTISFDYSYVLYSHLCVRRKHFNRLMVMSASRFGKCFSVFRKRFVAISILIFH